MVSSPDHRRWYVFRSKPHREAALSQISRRMGLEVFYPTLLVRPVNPRAATEVPFFPGYLFVHAELEKLGESCFRFMPFSQGLVTIGGEAAAMPEHEIHAIRRTVERIWNQGYCEPLFTPGEQIMVTEGVFEGYEGVVDLQLSGKERVRVLLKMLNQRYAPVELSVHGIKRLEI